MKISVPWASVWITGASSGIGRDVAVKLAGRGARVTVSARSADTLAALAAQHARITAAALDVTDRAAIGAVVAKIEAAQGPLDLVILNAGAWQPMGASGFDAGKSAQSMAVNYLGIANALEHVLPAMIARGRGHIALTASVAGYRGLPQAAAYAPSKAAVISLAEALKPDLARKGVTVSVINPGFVETPMTAVNRFPMPFLMPSHKAADAIIAGLEKGKFDIVFPWQMAALMKFARVLPYPAYFWFARNFMMPKRPPH